MSGGTWAAIATRLSSHADSAGELLQEALHVVREHPGDVTADLIDGREAYDMVLEVAAAGLRAGVPDVAGMHSLLARVSAASGGLLTSPTLAHALASAVDAVLFDDLVVECEHRGRYELADGDWFLKPQMNLFERLKERLGAGNVHLGPRTTHRDARLSEPAQTDRAALYDHPAGASWSVVMNWRHGDELDEALLGAPAVAAVHPFGPAEPMMAPQVIGGASFGLGPVDQRTAWESTVRALEQAHDQGAAVAVVPELVVGADITVDLTGRRVPQLVVSGSQHVIEGSKRRNRLKLHLRQREIVCHDKVVPFGEWGATAAAQQEAIHPGEVVEIVRSRDWAVVPLTCADVNDMALVGSLTRLRVNLVLVASMTQALGYFPANLRHVTTANQGMAVWVNQPPGGAQIDTSAFYLAGKTTSERSHRDDLPHVRIDNWGWVE